MVRSLNLDNTTPNLSIRTTDGSEHQTTAVLNIPFIANGTKKCVRTLIIPTITTQLILGTDFWETFGIRPMFCNIRIRKLQTRAHRDKKNAA